LHVKNDTEEERPNVNGILKDFIKKGVLKRTEANLF
jgi:hypothetical protein